MSELTESVTSDEASLLQPDGAVDVLTGAMNIAAGFDASDRAHGWEPTTTRDVEWVLTVMTQERAWADERLAVLDERIQHLDALRQKIVDQTDRSAGFWEGKLRSYYEAWRRSFPSVKTKTLEFGSGTISARKRPVTVEFDEAELLAWAEANRPELIRVKTSVDKTAVKTAVTKDGESIPGVTVVEPGDSLTVKLA